MLPISEIEHQLHHADDQLVVNENWHMTTSGLFLSLVISQYAFGGLWVESKVWDRVIQVSETG